MRRRRQRLAVPVLKQAWSDGQDWIRQMRDTRLWNTGSKIAKGQSPAGVGPEICLRQATAGTRGRRSVPDALEERATALRTRCDAAGPARCAWRFRAITGQARHAQCELCPEDSSLPRSVNTDRAFAAMVPAWWRQRLRDNATSHTEYLAERHGTPRVVTMMLAAGARLLRVALPTTTCAAGRRSPAPN